MFKDEKLKISDYFLCENSCQNVYKYLLCLIYVLLLSFFVFSEATFLAINDDFAVINLLRNGFSGTLILSYPMSYLLSCLYFQFPSIQWYSVLLTIGIVASIVLYHTAFFYFQKKNGTNFKIVEFFLCNAIGVAIHFFLFLNITITSVTVWYFMSSSLFYLITGRRACLLSFALLFRFDVALGLLPLFFTFHLLFFGEKFSNFNKLTKLMLLSILFGLCQWLLPSNEYNEWLEWNSARGYYMDLKQEPSTPGLLTDEQVKVLQESWWTYDEIMIPTSDVVNSTGGNLKIIMTKIDKFKLSDLNELISKDIFKVLWSFVFLSICLLFITRLSWLERLYVLFALSFILILVIFRNVERVSVWLLTGSVLIFWVKAKFLRGISTKIESKKGGG